MNISNRQIVYILAVMVFIFAASGGGMQGHANTAGGNTRDAALQSCPAVEEEIVDLELLATGLKDSKVIGVIDKIRLKSSIDGLIKRMQVFHEGKRTFSLAELQEQYDVLLMKIATHLQHKDMILHGQLCNAWGLIWLDLEDPERFAVKFQ